MAAALPQLQLQCYPEGGYLVANVPCHIGWETKTGQGEPVSVRAVVFENQQAIDTIKTNERGLGRSLLVPQPGAVYSIQPITWPAGIQLKESYQMPVVLENGVTLDLPKAIVNDSLRVHVFGSGYTTVQMVVYNGRRKAVLPMDGHCCRAK